MFELVTFFLLAVSANIANTGIIPDPSPSKPDTVATTAIIASRASVIATLISSLPSLIKSVASQFGHDLPAQTAFDDAFAAVGWVGVAAIVVLLVQAFVRVAQRRMPPAWIVFGVFVLCMYCIHFRALLSVPFRTVAF